MDKQYKDSGFEWIGKIPENWGISRLKFVLRSPIESGKRPNELEGKVLSVGGEHIQNGKFDLSHPMYITESTYFENKGKIKLHDTLVVKDGATIGKCMYVSSMPHEKMLLNEHVYRIDCGKFYYYWILSEISQKWFRVRNQSTAQESITGPTIMNLPIVCLDIKEQDRIVRYLDKKCDEIDSLIGLQEQMIEKLKAYKQSIITEAVTKGLNHKVKLVHSGIDWIGKIPEGWEVRKLKTIVSFIESGVSVNAGNTPAKESEIGVLKTSSVSKFSFNADENKTVNNNELGKVSCPVRANTIIVSRMNTPELVGACGYVEKDYDNIFLPDRLWQVHFREHAHVKFIWFSLSSSYIRNYYSSLSVGSSSSMQNISQDQFANAKIVMPPLSEQQTIASYLDGKCSEIDKLIALKQQKIEKLKDYKKSIIYEAVTGKTIIE